MLLYIVLHVSANDSNKYIIIIIGKPTFFSR